MTVSSTSWKRILATVARIGLGLILLYAGYVKAQTPWISFAATIYAYQLLPDDAVVFVARTLPWFEILLGGLLIIGFRLRWVASAVTLLLAGFFIAMLRSYAMGLQIDCGCFGPGDKLGWKSLVRDGLFLSVSIWMTIQAFCQSKQARRIQEQPVQP